MSRADNELCPHCNERHHPMTLCADARKQREPCPHCASLRTELAQARAERAGTFGSEAVLEVVRERDVALSDLAACRTTLRELAEAAEAVRSCFVPDNAMERGNDEWLRDLLARAEEEGKRDG